MGKTQTQTLEQSVVVLTSSTDSLAEMGMSGGSQTVNVWRVSKNRVKGRADNGLEVY